MNDASIGKIFLAEERGLFEMETFRTYSTFNFGAYQNNSKNAVGSFYVLNDETLAGQGSMQYFVEEDSLIVVLPIVGVVDFKSSKKSLVHAGEVRISFVRKNSMIEISNPYDDRLVNYLHLWFKKDVIRNSSETFSFDLDADKNNLMNVFHSGVKFSIGKFQGRSEAIYKTNPSHSVFAFVIQGAFEVQNRLLETRDGLVLRSLEEIEMEALSNEAILLLVEIP